MSGRVWAAIVKWFGGFYTIGRTEILVHDDGVYAAQDSIIVWEWRLRPPVVIRCIMRFAPPLTPNEREYGEGR